MTSTGKLYYSSEGVMSGTSDGVTDDQIGAVNGDGTGARVIYADTTSDGSADYYGVAIDPLDGLYFGLKYTDGTSDTAPILTFGHLTGGTTYTGTQGGTFALTSVFDDYFLGGLTIDPVNDYLYVGLQGDTTADTGIYRVSYNASTGALSGETLLVGASTGHVNSPNGLFVDVANQVLYYVDDETAGVGGDYASAGFANGANGIYKINLSNPTGTPTLLTSNAVFNASNNNPNGDITGLTVNLAKGVVYFTTQDTNYAANNESLAQKGSSQDSLWEISTSGGTATKIGSFAGIPAYDSLTYDPVGNQLYASDLGTAHVVQFTLNAAGTSVTSTNANVFTEDTSNVVDGETYENGLSFVDAPVISGFTGASTHPLQGAASGAAVLTGEPTLQEVNQGADEFVSASVQITNAQSGDILAAVTTGTSISASYNSTNHTLTLTGDDSPLHYAQVLATVSYQDTGTDASTGAHPTRSLTFTIDNGAATSTATTSLTIDRAPVATADTYTVASGSTLVQGQSGGVLANDTDADGDTLSATAGTAGANSQTPSLNANGSFTESLSTGYSIAHFTYEASDGTTTSSPVSVTIDFTAYDPKPVNDTANVAALGTLSVNAANGVISNDVDPENSDSTAHLSLVGVSNTTSGTGTIGSALVGEYGDLTLDSDGSYTYVAGETNGQQTALAALPMGTTGSDVFTYSETHTGGGLGSATLTVTVGDNPPVTATHDVSVLPGGTASASTPIDTDPDGDTLTVTAVTGGSVGSAVAGTYGSLTVNSDDTYSYSADAANSPAISTAPTGAHPIDSFTYTVDDGKGGTATETLDVSIDRAPSLTDQSHTVAAAGSLTEAAANGALSGDSDADGDTIAISAVTPSGGTLTAVSSSGDSTVSGTYGDLTVGGDGHYTYAAGATLAEQQALASAPTGAHPADDFTLTVGDSGGLATAGEALDFTIDRAPFTPTDGNAAANTVAEGAAAGTAIGVTASATDPDGDSLTYSLSADSSSGGFTVDAATGAVTVADPTKLDYAGSGAGHDYTVTVQASDGTLSSSQNFTIAVTDVDPTITGAQAGQTTDDTTSLSPFAQVVIAEPGSATQQETVHVTISDTANGSLTTASLTASGFVADGAVAGQYDFTATAAQDTTAITQLMFDPTIHQVTPGSTVTTTFTIAVGDGTASALNDVTTVIASSVNDAPTITGTAANQAVDDNATITPLSGVTIGDVDAGQTQTVTVTLDHPTYGALSNLDGGTYAAATGVYSFSGTAVDATTALDALVFTPTNNQIAPGTTETAGFTVTTNDGVASTVSDATTTVVITSINDAPTVTGTVAGQMVKDGASTTPFFHVTIGDVDTPAQTQTVTVTLSQPTYGALSNLDGGTYTAATGVYSFSGTAAAATTALHGLVFTPTTDQVASGASETEGFTIATNDGTAPTVSDATTTVVINAAMSSGGGGGGGGGGSTMPTTTDVGTSNDDTLTANAGGDTILALGGDDIIHGGSGHDMLYGNAGDDTITLYSYTDTSTVYGGMGDDVIDASASSHANFLSGDLGNDLIKLGSGADTAYGGDGDDTILGGSGQGQIYGNMGDDTITLFSYTASSTVYGGQGNDLIDASASTHANFISGDLGDDTIKLGSGADTAYGGAGDDTLIGGGGHDQLYGNAGNDTIALGSANLGSTVYGGQGDDVIDASASTHGNFISGDLGDDSIIAGTGDDTIHGGAGSDTIQAASGAVTYIHVGLADSSAASATDMSELDHVTHFGADTKLIFDGDPAATMANTIFHGEDEAITGYAAAYAYAYGTGTATGTITGAADYAVVSDSQGHVYVFAADHAAVEIDGLSAGVSGVAIGQILAG